VFVLGACLFACLVTPASAQAAPREFPMGRLTSLEELPAAARLRLDLERLPAVARARGLRWLQSFHFTEMDLPALRADAEGGIFYVCELGTATDSPQAAPAPGEAAAAVPVTPFPAALLFHSRPGAPNVLYLNFAGETVSNTQWNTGLNRLTIPALAFSTDTDRATFSDTEQVAVKRIWQRVAEDYAPFDVDVTTERPGTFNSRTAHALITRSTDANGDPNPSSTAGGVAYVNVFGTSSYAKYRPAWIYHNNLSNTESPIAEASAHEVGHNMGLSHDGCTDGTEYYEGHGSGDISWGPIMGASYGRNVTQWCRGEYYLANNTQDDLATMAGKIAYRTDDHGGTPGTASPLTFAGTNLVSTTPENDPGNTNKANKGVLERTADVDVFSFSTGSGAVRLNVNPWIVPVGTRGGNADISLELYSETGTLLLTNNPAVQTTALIAGNLAAGRYYLHVRNSGAGDPLGSLPSGYTSYGSIGQYFISGCVAEISALVVPPVAELQATELTQPGQTNLLFSVTYSDNVAVNVATIDSSDIRVTGPNGYDQPAAFLSLDTAGNGTPRTATYAIAPPGGGEWLPAANGGYTVWMRTNQVGDTEGVWAAAGPLGVVPVTVPATIYFANLDTNPGWTLEPQWQYGAPAYVSGGPPAGFTGTNIIGYNLSGNYANGLAVKYATTPPVNCSGSLAVTLRFKRWLRTKANDTASIQVSTNGTTWLTVWSTSSAVSDTGWQSMQYALPAGVGGRSNVRLRWGLASSPAQSEIGWNLDDVELLGDGSLDATPPLPQLSVADLTTGGSPSHSCTVTYTDGTGVRLSSLDSADLLVTGPNLYSNLAVFVGADLADDGSPLTATYSIPAPAGAWATGDNGTYTVTLLEGAVDDTLNNATLRTGLGTFTVAIDPPVTFELNVTVNNPAWGIVSPTQAVHFAGMTVEVLATAAPYCRFDGWQGDVTGTNNPLMLVMDTHITLQAVFAQVFTTNHPTPYGWLADYGYTNDFETAVTGVGANGMALWQSYIAGLNPADPESQLRLGSEWRDQGRTCVLTWNTVSGRVYSIWAATNLIDGFSPLSGAIQLPASIQSFTNAMSETIPQQFLRLEVQKP
jgi:hypothetical protein